MPAAVVAFFNSLPGWLQVTVSILVMVGTILAVWKGVIPLFFHRAPKFHKAVMYFRDQVVERKGKPVVKDPGPRGQSPGFYSYLDTDMRMQTTDTSGFSVDIGTPPTTYTVDGLSVIWQVVEPYRFQSIVADAERFVAGLVKQACRDVLASEGDANLSVAVITERCSRRTPTLTDAGVKLVGVLITSGSYGTRNHRFLNGETATRRTVTMADTEPE
jgi:hypothetical protein